MDIDNWTKKGKSISEPCIVSDRKECYSYKDTNTDADHVKSQKNPTANNRAAKSHHDDKNRDISKDNHHHHHHTDRPERIRDLFAVVAM